MSTGPPSRRAWRHRGVGMLLAGGILAAACTSSSGDVTTESANPIAPATGESVEASDPSTDPGSSTPGPDGLAESAPPDPSGLPSLTEIDPGTTVGVLDNGLRYMVRRNDNPGGKVEMRLAIDAGSALEDASQSGGAHFLEHMLFNGTERFPKNELIDVLRSFGAGFGADINAYTNFDETVYQLTVPADDVAVLDTALDVLQQWLSFATIDPDEVVAERGIVLDEWRGRTLTADGRLFDAFVELVTDGTDYQDRLPIGSEEAISATESAELRRFYDDWYRPDLASVIVVGDMDVARMERAIVERFSTAEPRGASPARPDLATAWAPDTTARVVSDPDLDEGYAIVAFPTATPVGAPEPIEQVDILRSIGLDIVATRLREDALRGEAPFDDASFDDSTFTRDILLPSVQVSTDGDAVEASIEAIVDEFERIRRFGVTGAELERATGSIRSSIQSFYDGRFSRQDASYADEYVRHVLEEEWYVTADREFEFVNAVLDRVTAESVVHVVRELLDTAPTFVFAAVRADEAAAAPSDARVIEVVDSVADRELEPRAATVEVGDQLMGRPAPVEEVASDALANDSFTPLLEPTVLTFPNGVRVALNTTTIVEGRVFFAGRSPGGLAAVVDDDVPDAEALGPVVGTSGVGAFDRVTLDAFLDDKEVSVTPFVDSFEDGLIGDAATSDLEVAMQLMHLLMTQPRVDPVALDQYVDDALPLAEDPGIDASYAEFDALLDARYDDVRFLMPTPASLATVDGDGIARVAAERFGDATDWTFSFSGDFDPAEAADLARSYLGTLPSAGRVETTDYAEPPPPPGVVVAPVEAGVGEQATVSFLFTSAASNDRRDDVLASIVGEVINIRLIDFIREELGESYSPFSQINLGGGATPAVDLYLTVSTAPDLVDNVSNAVTSQLTDLRANGPTQQEYDAAIATVGEQLNFINNVQINDEVLSALVDPAGSPSFDDFIYEFEFVETIGPADVQTALQSWTSDSDYIEVRVLPRS